jgi:hypothetical protein
VKTPGVCGESTHFYVHATLLKLCHVRAYFYAQAHGHFLGALICVRGDDDLAVDLLAGMARVKLHFANEGLLGASSEVSTLVQTLARLDWKDEASVGESDPQRLKR